MTRAPCPWVAEVRLVHLRLFLLLSSAGPAVGSAGRSPQLPGSVGRSPQLPDFTAREKCGGRSHALALLPARSVCYWSPFLARWLSLPDRERRILLLISLLGFCRCLRPCPLSELVLSSVGTRTSLCIECVYN